MISRVKEATPSRATFSGVKEAPPSLAEPRRCRGAAVGRIRKGEGREDGGADRHVRGGVGPPRRRDSRRGGHRRGREDESRARRRRGARRAVVALRPPASSASVWSRSGARRGDRATGAAGRPGRLDDRATAAATDPPSIRVEKTVPGLGSRRSASASAAADASAVSNRSPSAGDPVSRRRRLRCPISSARAAAATAAPRHGAHGRAAARVRRGAGPRRDRLGRRRIGRRRIGTRGARLVRGRANNVGMRGAAFEKQKRARRRFGREDYASSVSAEAPVGARGDVRPVPPRRRG